MPDPNLGLKLELETVTPLFLGGAEPRGTPELRIPSFRGALRYWLRAVLGGVEGGDVDAVYKAESAVFGSTDEETGGASSVSMRLTGVPRLQQVTYTSLTAWDQNTRRFGLPGLAYLWFAARGTRADPERNGLFGRFGLTLMQRPGASNTEFAFRASYCSWWLLTHLGGLGNRANRGAGSIQIQTARPTTSLSLPLPALPVHADRPDMLASEISDGLTQIRSFFGGAASGKSTRALSSFDMLHPAVCKIWVLDRIYDDWKKALDEVGGTYQRFRNRRDPDYLTIKEAMLGRTDLSEPVQRAAFGLPVPYLYRSLERGKGTLQGEEHDRRVSPLRFHVTRLATGKYAVILIWFRSEFLPSAERLKLEYERQSFYGEPPDESLIEKFLLGRDEIKQSSLKDKRYTLLEVRYV